MLLDKEDIVFCKLPNGSKLDAADDSVWRFRVHCPNCSHECKARGSFLGKKVRCPKCQHDFTADWGEPVAAES